MKLLVFSRKAGESLHCFLNKLEVGVKLGYRTNDYKAGQLYVQLTGGVLQFADFRQQKGTTMTTCVLS